MNQLIVSYDTVTLDLVLAASGCTLVHPPFQIEVQRILVPEFIIHEQSEGALINPELLAPVLTSFLSLSGCCLYGSKTYFAWHRQKYCSRERLGIHKDADKKSDCLRKDCWLENRLHEPCLPCLCRRSID